MRLLAFCATSGFVCFASVAAWAALGRLIRRWLVHPPYQKLFHRVLAQALRWKIRTTAEPAVYRALDHVANVLASGCPDALEVDEMLLSFIA